MSYQTETVRVTWTTDVEVKLGTLPRFIAQSVAEGYFQPRIADGEPDSACVFDVGGIKVDLSIQPSFERDMVEAAERAISELDGMAGDMIPDMDGVSSVVTLRQLIREFKERS